MSQQPLGEPQSLPNRMQSPYRQDPEKYLRDGYWRHNRFYGSWRLKYLVPIDREELNRLDILHKVFLVARGDRVFNVPIRRLRPKIMDLGTGTGIWPIGIIEESYVPDAQMMMVDINQIQPSLIPPNVHSIQFDIEEPRWDPLMTDCDLIHLRMMLGSVQTDLWPQIYRNIFHHLTPGNGHLEQVEIDWTPRWEEGEVQNSPAFQRWADLYLSGMDQLGRSARVSPQETRRMIEAAGFVDYKVEVIKAYVCPWSQDLDESALAKWFNLALSHSFEALGLMPLIEKHGFTREEVLRLARDAKSEICILRNHVYCTIYVWTARKPRPQII